MSGCASNVHAVATLRTATVLQAAVVQRGPLAHPAEPVPTVLPRVHRRSVVGAVGYAVHQGLFVQSPTLLDGDRAELAALYERQGRPRPPPSSRSRRS
jgi:hypothetical protein